MKRSGPSGIDSILRTKARKEILLLLAIIALIPLLLAPFCWRAIPFLWTPPSLVTDGSSGTLNSEFVLLALNKTPLHHLGRVTADDGHTYHAYCWPRRNGVVAVLSYKTIAPEISELVVNRDLQLQKNADLKRLVTDKCRAKNLTLRRAGYVTTPLDSTVIFVAGTVISLFLIIIVLATAAPMFIEPLFWRRCLVARSEQTAVLDFRNRWRPELTRMFSEGRYRQHGCSVVIISDQMIALSGFGETWFIEKGAINRITTTVIPVLKFKLTYVKVHLYNERVIWAQLNSRLVAELPAIA